MSKPLVYVNTKVKVDGVNGDLRSWELIAFSPSPVMHAAWNPVKQVLVVQIDSVKEGFVDYPNQSKTGKVTMQERRIDQYYRVTIEDKEAIQHILENFVSNYDNQEWEMEVLPFEEAEIKPVV